MVSNGAAVDGHEWPYSGKLKQQHITHTPDDAALTRESRKRGAAEDTFECLLSVRPNREKPTTLKSVFLQTH